MTPGGKVRTRAAADDLLDVVVVGSANVDRIVTVGRHPQPGETVTATGQAVSAGGKGANQAVGVARAGGRTALVALVGDDAEGHWLRGRIAAHGVDVTRVEPVAGNTGSAYITVDAAGQNTIVVAAGANHSTRWPQTLDRSLPPARFLLMQNELPMDVLDRVLRDPGRPPVALNLAPYSAVSPALLGRVDVLIVNELEAAGLLGESSARSPAEAADSARRLRDLGPDVVVVTLGAQGAVAADEHGVHLQEARPVRVVDTTGAGDSFSGALILALARRTSLPAALAAAAHAAAVTVAHAGAQPEPEDAGR